MYAIGAIFSKMVLQKGTQHTFSVYSDVSRSMENRPPQSAVFKELRPVRIGTQDKNKSLQDWQIRFSSPLVKLFSKQPSFPLELKGKEIPRTASEGEVARLDQDLKYLSRNSFCSLIESVFFMASRTASYCSFFFVKTRLLSWPSTAA